MAERRRWLSRIWRSWMPASAVPGAASTLALLIVLASAPCHAFFDAPTVVPPQPASGQVVSVSIRGGVCDLFTDRPQDTQITVTGSDVRMVIDGIHSDDPAFCLSPVSTFVYPVGAFAPGAYTLTVFHRYQNFLGNFVEQPIGSVSFTVSASAIPTARFGMWIAVAFVILLLGARRGVLRHGNATGDS